MREASKSNNLCFISALQKEHADPLEQFCEGNPDADECRSVTTPAVTNKQD